MALTFQYIAAGNQGGEIKILKNTSAAISDDASLQVVSLYKTVELSLD